MDKQHKTGQSNTTSKTRATLRDVAKHCQVHPVTVSRALQPDNPHVGEELRARILAAAQELGYDPALGHAARRLRLTASNHAVRNHVVAIFLPDAYYDFPYFQELLRGVTHTLIAHRYCALLHYASRDDYPIPPVVARGDVDGIIICIDNPDLDHLITHLREQTHFGQRPLVSLLDTIPGFSCAGADDVRGGYLAARHLLDLGHRRLLHFVHYPVTKLVMGVERLCDFDHPSQMQRLEGYRAACREMDLNPDDVVHQCWVGQPHEEGELTNRVLEALRSPIRPTAILARNDYMAGMLHTILTRHGVRIPEEISLIGYDDTDPILSPEGQNLLTTVRVPLRQIGDEAARIMIRHIEEPSTSVEEVLLPVELLIRQTTATAIMHE